MFSGKNTHSPFYNKKKYHTPNKYNRYEKNDGYVDESKIFVAGKTNKMNKINTNLDKQNDQDKQERQDKQDKQYENTQANLCEQNSKKTFIHTTKFPSYLFNFDTQTIEQLFPNTEIELSLPSVICLKNSFEEINKKIQCFENYYVVCPVYVSKTTKKILDTQVTVTGKCHKNEIKFLATIREMQEELGITSEIEKIFNYATKVSTTKTEEFFIADISNSRHFDPKQDKINLEKDDRSRKIHVVVYGKQENLLQIYTNVLNRPESNDIETIKFVRFLSLKEFL